MKLEDMEHDSPEKMGECIIEASRMVCDFFKKHDVYACVTLELFSYHWLAQVVQVRTSYNLQHDTIGEEGLDVIKEFTTQAIENGIQNALDEFEKEK